MSSIKNFNIFLGKSQSEEREEPKIEFEPTYI